jgi:hypothetical protein
LFLSHLSGSHHSSIWGEGGVIALTLVASRRSGYQYQTDYTWINPGLSALGDGSPAQAGVVRVKLQDLLDDCRIVIIKPGSVSGKVVGARQILV